MCGEGYYSKGVYFEIPSQSDVIGQFYHIKAHHYFLVNTMASRGNKYVKRATLTEKKRRSWNALEKLAIILYQEKVCSVRSAANNFKINKIGGFYNFEKTAIIRKKRR